MSKNRGIEIPLDSLFQLVIAGLHPSVRAKLEYPAPLTIPELFVWYEKILPTISPDDEFRLAMVEPAEPDHCVAEDQCPNLIVHVSYSGQCFKCGQSGHIGKFCPNKRLRSIQGKRKIRKRKSGNRHTKKGNGI